MKSELRITIQIDVAGERLDVSLLDSLRKSEHSRAISRAQLKSLFHEKRVRYAGRAISASFLLPPGSHEIIIEELAPGAFDPPEALAAPTCFLPVVHEDEELLVLHKTSGTPSVPQAKDESTTAVSAAFAALLWPSPGPVARLRRLSCRPRRDCGSPSGRAVRSPRTRRMDGVRN